MKDKNKLNINTRTYWDMRFTTGNWKKKGGEQQTKDFAKKLLRYLKIKSNFNGTILDFGCALGNAILIYSSAFPKAKLLGVDISSKAIEYCNEKYGEIANFICGDHNSFPIVDIIIASNVFEHLSDDINIAKQLLSKCRELYILVPYRQDISQDREHMTSYNERHFEKLDDYNYKIFRSKGWSVPYVWYNSYLKNILRPLVGKKKVYDRKMILFHFTNR